jgi:hypothetical protein
VPASSGADSSKLGKANSELNLTRPRVMPEQFETLLKKKNLNDLNKISEEIFIIA